MCSDKYSQRPLCEHRVPGLNCRVGTWLSPSCAIHADGTTRFSLGYREYPSPTEQAFPRWDSDGARTVCSPAGFILSRFLLSCECYFPRRCRTSVRCATIFATLLKRAWGFLGLWMQVLSAGTFWLKRRWVHVRRKLFVHERIGEYGAPR